MRVGTGRGRAGRAHARTAGRRGAVTSPSSACAARDGLAVRAAHPTAADALHAPPAAAHAGSAARRVAVHSVQALLGRLPDLLVRLISACRVGRAAKVETRLDGRHGLVILDDGALEHASVRWVGRHLGHDLEALVLDVGVGLGGEAAGQVFAYFQGSLGGGGGILGDVHVQVARGGGRGGLGGTGQCVAVHDDTVKSTDFNECARRPWFYWN